MRWHSPVPAADDNLLSLIDFALATPSYKKVFDPLDMPQCRFMYYNTRVCHFIVHTEDYFVLFNQRISFLSFFFFFG